MTVYAEAAHEQLPPEQQRLRTRLWNAYIYGSTPVLVFLAFFSALVVGAVLIVISDDPTRSAMGYFFQHPSDTFTRGWHAISLAYSQLFQGSILNGDSLYSNGGVPVLNPISDTLTNATPLMLGGLSVGLAFRAGLFNIGGQGQIIAGAICAGYVGFAWDLPAGLHVIVAVVAGAVGGAAWGGIAGLLKAKTGAHEVITTIMLNYIALYLLGYLLVDRRLPEAAFQRGDLAAPSVRRRCCRTCSGRIRSCGPTSGCSSPSRPRSSAGGC